jgi:hypothetical protein
MDFIKAPLKWDWCHSRILLDSLRVGPRRPRVTPLPDISNNASSVNSFLSALCRSLRRLSLLVGFFGPVSITTAHLQLIGRLHSDPKHLFDPKLQIMSGMPIHWTAFLIHVMWRNGWAYSEWVKFGSNAGQLGTGQRAAACAAFRLKNVDANSCVDIHQAPLSEPLRKMWQIPARTAWPIDE